MLLTSPNTPGGLTLFNPSLLHKLELNPTSMKFQWFFNLLVSKGYWKVYGPYATYESACAAQAQEVKNLIISTRWKRVSMNMWYEPVQAPATTQQNAQGQQ